MEPTTLFTFSEALTLLHAGNKLARQGWNGTGMYIHLQRPDANSKMKRPYIYIVPDADSVVPWVASQRDLLETDWYIVNE